MNHIVLVVFDSTRLDAFTAAAAPNVARLGAAQRRFSYASWTPPSHHAMVMGQLPHRGRPAVFTSVEYQRELWSWVERIGARTGSLDLRGFLPRLSLPMFLRSLGYRCEAYVSLPVLSSYTLIAADFDRFELMPSHNHFAALMERVRFSDQPTFFLLNAGETHYPYAVHGERTEGMPHLPGLHGVLKGGLVDLSTAEAEAERAFAAWCTEARMRRLFDRQVACVEHLDRLMGQLMSRAPASTWFIVTSDHGELFGEDGYFGHGPVMHPKVFEVFLVEGRRP
jgi:hypothetical protein